MAILPTRLLEVEFDAGVWTDLFADVVDVGSRRGRNRESGAHEAGTVIVSLRNDTRKYDPDNAAGPYYGKLRPNRRVRFRATYSAVTYNLFQGYIDKWAQNYEGPNAGSATLEATDLFKILNRAELVDSVYAAEVLTDLPLAWYQLDDLVGSTTALDSVAGNNATVFGTVTFGASGLVVRDAGTSMQPVPAVVSGSQSTPAGIRLPRAAIPTGTGAFTFEWVANFGTGVSGASQPLLVISGSGSADQVTFGIEGLTGGQLWPYVLQGEVGGGGTFVKFTSSPTLDDGAVHHLAFVRSGTTVTCYVDGVSRGTATINANLGPIADFGSPWSGAPAGIRTGMLLAHFATWASALTGARVAAHNTAARTPWNGDLPGTRLGRILDLAAVPAADRNLDAGTTTLQATSLGGDPLSYAQKVEETEQGRLFITGDGKVRFIGRDAASTGTYLTSKATLVDADSGAGLGYRLPSAEVAESFMVTRATVSREGSIAVQYYDAAAKAEFGWLDEVHDGLLHNSDAYSAAYAQWIVATHKTPATRIGAVALELTGDPTNMYPAILGLELADRVTYKRKPQNVGAVFSQAMRVEAIAHETGDGYWRTTLQLSPIGPGGYGVGVWDTGLWDQAIWGI